MRVKLNVLILLFFLGMQLPMKSQIQLVVSMLSGEDEVFMLEEIRSMRFENDEMIVHLLEGIDYRFDIAGIEQYYFNGLTGLNGANSEGNSSIHVYPNPSDGPTSVSLVLSTPSKVMLEVLDYTGKVVQSVYHGSVSGNQHFIMHSDLPVGMYLCRAITEHQVLSQLFVIQ